MRLAASADIRHSLAIAAALATWLVGSSGFQLFREGRYCRVFVSSTVYYPDNVVTDYTQMLQSITNDENATISSMCSRFRSILTTRLLEVYKCDLPSTDQINLMRLLMDKAYRYNRFIRFELAFIEGAQAVEAYDGLVATCVEAFLTDETMIAAMDKRVATTTQPPTPRNTHRSLPTTAPTADFSMMPNEIPTPPPTNSTKITRRPTKRRSRRKTSPPTPPPLKPIDPPEAANMTESISTEKVPTATIESPAPSPTNRFPTAYTRMPPPTTERPTATTVPTSEPSSQPKDQGLTTTGSSDTSQGISDRLANEFSEMSWQLSAMSGALMLILALLIFIAVIGLGALVWRSWRARSRPSEYQPLFPVYPSLGSPD